MARLLPEIDPVFVAAFGTGDYIRDTTTRKNASFVLSVSSLPSTVGEIVGFTLATETCEQGLFTIDTLSDSVGIGNLVAAKNDVFQHKTAISSLILGSAQVPLYARGTQRAGSTSAWGEVGSNSIPIRVRAASASNIYFLLVADSAYTPKKSGKFYLTAKSKY